MLTWYVIMAAWIVVTIIDCYSNSWTKANVILKDLCIVSNIIAIISLTAGA